MSKYNQIYEAIKSKLNEVREENNRYSLIIVGEYRDAYAMPMGKRIELFNEYLERDSNELDIDKSADYNEQFEQFNAAICKGETFGDYQEFEAFSDRIEHFADELDEFDVKDKDPRAIFQSSAFNELTMARINGGRLDVTQSLSQNSDSFGELYELLAELATF